MIEQADFTGLWETAKEALGEDLLKAQEYTLFPGQTQDVDVALEPAGRYLAAVAIFRQPTGTMWRSIVPLPSSERMCSEYAQKGAPSPAVIFRFDQYRVESRSRLLSADGDHDLPTDVAPVPTSGGETRR